MTIKDAIDEMRERMIELSPNTVEYNCGYADAIRDLEQMVEDDDND